jgi:hypothetical protein
LANAKYDIAILKMSEAPVNATHGLFYMKKATNSSRHMATYWAGFNEQWKFQSSFGTLDVMDSSGIREVTNGSQPGNSGGPCVDSRDTDLVGMIREASTDDVSGRTALIDGLTIQMAVMRARQEENIPSFEDKTF